ncbi:MAG: hypothetical protein JWN68_1810 [Nocardioides sp.]|jgi:hypothetical protein|uniref:hypothetical protein n=1 Tax=Nocardioides sp. TaxID=35761 RepID=UPI002627AE87|nr:hypothetical protein [Nocardioides sp.]MCW2833857.1 hypothetical protein [Nocardioides sp.]
MADKDPEENLSLQLPSFGFGRKKSKDEPVEPTTKTAESAETVESTRSPTTPSPRPSSSPRPKRDVSSPSATSPKAPKPATPAPVAPELDTEASGPRPAAAPAPGPAEHVDPGVRPSGASSVTQTQQPPAASEVKRGPSFPTIPALQAVLAVGALIGILGVLLTFASLKFCELVRGTDSCGGPGLLLLLATLVVLTYVGAWLLRGFGIDDPGSTSFLAVALLAVMTMVFFLDVIYSWWLVLVIPLVSMATYTLAWWVTGFVDTDDSPT